MSKTKKIKDPIYGYVEIPGSYIEIIDTPVFQRLRRIVQTSYAPLYSSAVHNRFVHSIGVFYLGCIAIDSLQKNTSERILKYLDNEESYREAFRLACLLHDVGHAPFSHTGEDYYMLNGSIDNLHNELMCQINSSNFDNELSQLNKSDYAKPHEIMSAIIGLKEFAYIFKDDSCIKEFFARCILGYSYSEISNSKYGLLNCYISLLNSNIIDVDKLDYLLRDAQIAGYDTVKIDYIRLLQAVKIISYKGQYRIAFLKSALSVIENVIYAHDSEKKWIQSHPTVQYEGYIIKNVIDNITRFLKTENGVLFSSKTLGVDGCVFTATNDSSYRIRLLCDDDIIFLLKNNIEDEIAIQFFDRSRRMHPLWKSEAELKTFLLNKLGKENRIEFQTALSDLQKCQKDSEYPKIDASLITKIENEIAEYRDNRTIDLAQREAIIKNMENIVKIVRCLVDFAEDNGIRPEFIIIPSNMFSSGFDKPNFKEILIEFSEGKVDYLGEVINTPNNHPQDYPEKMFYIYFHRDKAIQIDFTELYKSIIIAFTS